MRPPNQSARDQLVSVLGRMPRASAPGLAAALRVSVRSLHRLLAELPPGQWVSAGRSRRTRYALRRPLRGNRTDIPLYAVDATGKATLVSNLALVHPQGALMTMADSGWPVPPESRDGWWDGLPYPLYDIRPQGYLGRQIASAEHQALGVSSNPEEWSDDDIVFVLSHAGADVSGNLLLGDDAYRRWLRTKLAPPEPASEANLGEHYADRAQHALMGGAAGSSAAGEFPKFTALHQHGHATPHVLVKFSGAGESCGTAQADLRVRAPCPRMRGDATRCGKCAHSRRYSTAAEFRRSVRRVDLHGRLPVCTLEALNHAFLGRGSTDWTLLLSRLHESGLVDADTVSAVERLWWFGRLIANTDMHLGNLGFHLAPTLRLAPAYDMLPMTYAPLPGGEVPPREFTPPLPLPAQREVWQVARTAALGFWHRASTDMRLSATFQSVCAAN